MGEKTLVDELIEDSIKLIRKLDANVMAPDLVVWYFYEDADEWRLLIAGHVYDELISKNEALGYQKLSESISSADLQTISISLIKLIHSNSPLVVALSSLIGTPPDGLVRAHFTDTTLNGIFIKEMLIIRSTKGA
jgi:hypothetical protein